MTGRLVYESLLVVLPGKLMISSIYWHIFYICCINYFLHKETIWGILFCLRSIYIQVCRLFFFSFVFCQLLSSTHLVWYIYIYIYIHPLKKWLLHIKLQKWDFHQNRNYPLLVSSPHKHLHSYKCINEEKVKQPQPKFHYCFVISSEDPSYHNHLSNEAVRSIILMQCHLPMQSPYSQ